MVDFYSYKYMPSIFNLYWDMGHSRQVWRIKMYTICSRFQQFVSLNAVAVLALKKTKVESSPSFTLAIG